MTGILVLVHSSSGRIVRNCSNAGTVVGFLPNESIMFCTGSSHWNSWRASPEIARQSCTMIVRGPA